MYDFIDMVMWVAPVELFFRGNTCVSTRQTNKGGSR